MDIFDILLLFAPANTCVKIGWSTFLIFHISQRFFLNFQLKIYNILPLFAPANILCQNWLANFFNFSYFPKIVIDVKEGVLQITFFYSGFWINWYGGHPTKFRPINYIFSILVLKGKNNSGISKTRFWAMPMTFDLSFLQT